MHDLAHVLLILTLIRSLQTQVETPDRLLLSLATNANTLRDDVTGRMTTG